MSTNGDQGPTCGGCRHFVAANNEQGVCYFNPPTPYPVPTQTPVALPGNNPTPGIAVIQLRAPVGPNDLACGQHAPVEESPGDI